MMNVFSGPAKRQTVLTAAGAAMIALWAGLWIYSVGQNRLADDGRTWVPAAPFLCCDFDINYYAVQTWFGGGNPYHSYVKGSIPGYKYDHPPFVLVVFSWCRPLSHQTALIVWMTAQGLIAVVAAAACRRSRRDLGLSGVPLALALAAFLCSYPLLFEMERGNWNVLVLLLALAAARALRGRSLGHDLAAGLAVACAAWIKMYPGLLFLALLGLRRWRAAAICSVAALVIGVASFPNLAPFVRNIRDSANACPNTFGNYAHWLHTLGGAWRLFCADWNLGRLVKLPGAAGWALLILPVVCLVTYRVARAAEPSRLLYPYLLWLTAAATYLPSIANDYNLIFLPLAALAVWDRRDPVVVHVLMAGVLLWWQPFALPVSAQFLWYCKLIGLTVVAASLTSRAREQAGAALRVLEPRSPEPRAVLRQAA